MAPAICMDGRRTASAWPIVPSAGDLRGLSAGSAASADAVNQAQRRSERGGSRMSLERTVDGSLGEKRLGGFGGLPITQRLADRGAGLNAEGFGHREQPSA